MKLIGMTIWLAAVAVVVALIAIGLAFPGLLRPGSKQPPISAGHPRPAQHPRHHHERVERRRQRGFPDAADTGVPAGTRLRTVPGQVRRGKGWAYDQRGWVRVYGHGAVLTDLNIPCDVSVTGSDITIRNVKVTVGGADAIGIGLRHARNVTIEDSTISGMNTGAGRMMTGVKDVYGDATGVRVLDDDISRFETGVQVETGLIADNYIHEPGFLPGDHTNGVTSNGGVTTLLTISHNTIFINRGQTDAIGLFEDHGVQQNRRITDNLLAGGSYAIYAGQKQGGPPTSKIVITGNLISTIYYAHGGNYGCAAHFDSRGRENIWSGNTWNTTSVPDYSACD
ncbi:MAG TPA: hypothetical protein VN767_23135 [Streptosporangiaceae bacterium]|nr:hypothetical protein [Streptosporangiaceae bacterium]